MHGNDSSLNPDDRDDWLIDRVYMVYRILFSVVGLTRTYHFSKNLSLTVDTSSGVLRGSVNVLKEFRSL